VNDRLPDDVLLARAYLNRVAEPGCVPLWMAVEQDGPIETARRIRSGDTDGELRAATATRAASCDPAADLDTAARLGVRLVVPESPDWPHFAMACFAGPVGRRTAAWRAGERRVDTSGEPVPPLALWVRGGGDLTSIAIRSVGIVGARAATVYGEQVAGDFASGLASRGFVVVSGGAFGIDSAAHRGALAVGGSCVIVSAGGLDRAYPSAHERLFERVADNGLLVSECPPGAAPQRHRFLIRNRLIAAFATGTVVVEAAERSGARNTARHCCVLGRPLMAVPGPVTSRASVGCHQLLAAEESPARLVTSVDDVLEVIGAPSDLAGTDPGPDRSTAILDTLDAVGRQVFDGFPARRTAYVDELAMSTGLPALQVIRALPGLELAGLVEAVDGGFRITGRARSDALRLRAQLSLG
jgi:DNA processing protein